MTIDRNPGQRDGLARPDSVHTVLAGLPVIIVGFRNPGDVLACLRGLACLDAEDRPAIFICENGGREAFDILAAKLLAPGGPCERDTAPALVGSDRFRTVFRARLKAASGEDFPLHLAQAVDNLGYAGAVNAWLAALLPVAGWRAAWVLNPDAVPAPDALSQLATYARLHGKAMVGSRLFTPARPEIVQCHGLAWAKWRASTLCVGLGTPVSAPPPAAGIDAILQAPSGASLYVTRDCLERIGLMDERYFLYYEDLDWGLRAASCGGTGYAHASIVSHGGGTTIGPSSTRARRSSLSIYLEFRNRLLFTHAHYPRWYAWTIMMTAAHALRCARTGGWAALRSAWQGTLAGLRRETGRPDAIMRAHLASAMITHDEKAS